MWLSLATLLVGCGLCTDGAGAHDVPLETGIGGPDRLQSVERQLAQLTTQLAQLSGRLETRMAQLTDGEWRPADCAAVQQRHRISGVYTVFPPVCGNGGGIRVFCDMETDGGGWTVLSRRADVLHHQDFDLNWQSYKWGFGNLSAEFWLGNEYLNLLTSADEMQLRVDLKDWENGSAYATYTPFSVGTEEQKFALKIGKYEGTAGNSLAYSNGMKFTTKDQDNDNYGTNCAVAYPNGWWFKTCFEGNLLGQYKKGTIPAWKGLVWKHWKGEKYSLKRTEMKIRPLYHMTWCHRLI